MSDSEQPTFKFEAVTPRTPGQTKLTSRKLSTCSPKSTFLLVLPQRDIYGAVGMSEKIGSRGAEVPVGLPTSLRAFVNGPSRYIRSS